MQGTLLPQLEDNDGIFFSTIRAVKRHLRLRSCPKATYNGTSALTIVQGSKPVTSDGILPWQYHPDLWNKESHYNRTVATMRKAAKQDAERNGWNRLSEYEETQLHCTGIAAQEVCKELIEELYS